MLPIESERVQRAIFWRAPDRIRDHSRDLIRGRSVVAPAVPVNAAGDQRARDGAGHRELAGCS